jgi:hypothetical protein
MSEHHAINFQIAMIDFIKYTGSLLDDITVDDCFVLFSSPFFSFFFFASYRPNNYIERREDKIDE